MQVLASSSLSFPSLSVVKFFAKSVESRVLILYNASYAIIIINISHDRNKNILINNNVYLRKKKVHSLLSVDIRALGFEVKSILAGALQSKSTRGKHLFLA